MKSSKVYDGIQVDICCTTGKEWYSTKTNEEVFGLDMI